MTIQSDLINLQNATQSYKASQGTTNKTAMDGDMFLQLLTEQLKYQDPLNPMDNTDMLAQEAQFAALEQMEALASSFASFSNAFQANNLMGQTVEVKVDNEVVKGKVEYVDMTDSNGASISIGGKLYPISSVQKVYPDGQSSSGGSSSSDENGENKLLQTINDNIGKITEKISNYMS